MSQIVWLFMLLSAIVIVKSARILSVFPIPCISHQVVFRKLTHELVNRGHNVTIITTDPAYPEGKTPENLTEIDIHDIYDFKNNLLKNLNQDEILELTKERGTFIVLGKIFEIIMNLRKVENIYLNKSNETYDLILLDGMTRLELVLSYVYNAPVILISSYSSSVDVYKAVGVPTHPILHPTVFYERLYNLTMYEKIKTIFNSFVTRYEYIYLNENDNSILQKYYGPNVPSLKRLYDNVAMLFLNVHPIWVDNQPVPPSVIYMGGVYKVETKELPKDLKSYLDASLEGVIYLSFGTNLQSTNLPKHKIKLIAEVLSELPYDVLWKWDEDELPIRSTNIKLSKWYPQSDLLKHPKIKLFITHAGLQSTEESINAGVPFVAFPVFGDQFYNAEKFVRHSLGKMFRIEHLNAKDFKEAVEEVIKDDRYRQNVIKLRNLIQNQDQPPLERAMWWIEHILQHGGGKHLRAPAANVSWVEYYQVDVMGVICCTLVLIILILLKIFNISCMFFSRQSKPRRKHKRN